MPAAQSGHIYDYDYDPTTMSLVLRFVNGAVYLVSGVPPTEYDAFNQSSSKGSYLHAKLEPNYQITRVSAGYSKGSGRRRGR